MSKFSIVPILFLYDIRVGGVAEKILLEQILLHLHNEINWIQSAIDYKQNDL